MKFRFWMFSLLVALLCATSVYAEDIEVPHHKYVLENGLTVILYVDNTLPLITVNILYDVGSAEDVTGKTGFAHLFEHFMFDGSANVPNGHFDKWLEPAGASSNAFTNFDMTVYYESFTSNALDRALFLESDRMGFLLGENPDEISKEAMERIDEQRNIIRQEREENYSKPYGMAWLTMHQNLFPEGHPYHRTVIGKAEDLDNASFEDVANFYRTYYVPNNATMVIAGNIDIDETKALVQKWFGDIPRGKLVPKDLFPQPSLEQVKRIVIEDPKISLPRLDIGWHSPERFQKGEAAMLLLGRILAGDRNSRLVKRLVYGGPEQKPVAQQVSAGQNSFGGAGVFQIVVLARPGISLKELENMVQEEIHRIQKEPPTKRELERFTNGFESNFVPEIIGGQGSGLAFELNWYNLYTDDPDYFAEDLARYLAVTPQDISDAAKRYLKDNGSVVLSIVPPGQQNLAALEENPSEEKKSLDPEQEEKK